MIKTITKVDYLPDVALVTINNIPNSPHNLAVILGEIAQRQVTVDMICQTAPYRNTINLSFTVPQDNLAEVIAATAVFKSLSPDISTDMNGNNIKVLFSGDKMRDTYGVAAELFLLFDQASIPVKLITTAETEISCLVDIRDVDRVKTLLDC